MTGWTDLITDESTAHATCSICPDFHSQGTGEEGLSQVMRAIGEHAALGIEHSVSVEVEL